MTPPASAARREGGTRLCRQLSAKVAEIAPTGIGRWDGAWDIVTGADAAFMLALTRWEASGDERHEPPLRATYDAVLDAWRQAALEHRHSGAGLHLRGAP